MAHPDPTTSVADPHAGEPEQTAAPCACVLPAQPADSGEGRAMLRAARAFAATGLDPDGRLEALGDGDLPALMHAMRDPERVRTGEPLVLSESPDRPPARVFAEWLADAIESTFAEGEARELRDNTARIERAARRLAGSAERPETLGAFIEAACETVIAEVSLKGPTADAMRRDAAAIASAAAAEGTLVPFDDGAALAVLVHLAARTRAEARAAYRAKVESLCERLRRKLEQDAAHTAPSVGSAGATPSAAIDVAALAGMLGRKRGPKGLGDARRARLESLVSQLDAFLAEPDGPTAVVVGAAPGAGAFEPVPSSHPCRDASRAYDELAERRVPAFLAVRVAELEADDRFDPAVHAVHAEAFGRASLSIEEVGVLPAVVALETRARLMGEGMADAAGMLLGGRPVRVLVLVDPGAAPEPGVRPAGSRFEPGLFAIGLRAPIVHQSSPTQPEHLVAGLTRALASERPSLHVVSTGRPAGGGDPAVGRWLHAGAAADARAHPVYLYDPTHGETWADRFDFVGNDQPERDWPEHELDAVDMGGVGRPTPVAFTFADFAALEPAWRGELRLIPGACPTPDLAPLAEVLASPREHDRRVPFVWVAGEDGRLRRAAVSRRLVEACLDRRGAWRTLQQAAGIHDVYADRAAETERRRASEAADERIARLEAEHAAELDRVRREEASLAFERLAQAIVGLDASALAAPTARAPAATPAPTPSAPDDTPPAPEPEAPAAEPDDDEGFDDPYIDSMLCTSCNDCVNLNPRLFVYNANKQATIGDPDAGAFVELVTAAEKCPARCIHPGKPRNPGEPGLDALIARAKPFT